uniref:Uncharacterized protein n=1 Tax=Triticum urartu TaxID=4572 RepID=A0A8R7U5N5_TRIUA
KNTPVRICSSPRSSPLPRPIYSPSPPPHPNPLAVAAAPQPARPPHRRLRGRTSARSPPPSQPNPSSPPMDAAPTTSSNRKPQFDSLCSRPSAATSPPLQCPARPYPTPPFSAHPSACPPGNARLNCCCQDLPQCGLHHCGDDIVDLRL